MAISFTNKEAFLAAKAIGGEDRAKIIEAYKKSGQSFVEGDNDLVSRQPCYQRFLDEEKPKKAKKVKLGGKKKKK